VSAADEDLCDYAALERLWPIMRYGDPSPGSWFRFVGRTRPMREALQPMPVSRGPRGLVRDSRGVRFRTAVSGEFEAR
jgi:hypothetical protein